ncbi:MAG TPA: PQQ-binding-like beta-propeller repeat protein [Candidatus Thermoplasmatota archaeon]|nr:PQQ-binding-like beta-propeller repeat protein [Candidatus Thermoplasmatota archaeon]
MHSHDVLHTGRSSYSTMNITGTEIWRKSEGRSGSFYGTPIIDNNSIIYFGTTGSDSSLYAFYLNGTRKWRYISDGSVWATPAINEDGTIIFPTWGGDCAVHAVYPNGTVKWTYRDNYETGSLSSPAIGSDRTIYFGSDDYPNYNIYAINANGTLRWKYSTGFITNGAPAIGSDGTIYIGSSDHHLYAMNPNGTLRWRFDAGSYIKGAATITSDGTIYVPAFNGYFYALAPNGTLLWQGYTGDSVAAAGLALAMDNTIYVGTEMLRAYYPNGSLKWSVELPGAVFGTVPAVSADGTIYVSAGRFLVAINPDGTERWRKEISTKQIRSSPSIGPDDRIYVGSNDQSNNWYIHAFGTMENNQPPEKPTIDGPAQAKIRTSVTYIFQANDTDNTPISYYVDWGDGTNEQTMDYMPGFAASLEHTWMKKGTYTIKAKAIDTFGLESDWGTLTVTMPFSYEPQFPFIHWLLERFANAFPILRQIMGY